MYAAVVNAFDAPPRYQEFADPAPAGEHDVLVDVLAVGLHPRVRSQASGSPLHEHRRAPADPGDRRRRPAARRRRAGLLRAARHRRCGAMAERVVIDRRRSIELAGGRRPGAARGRDEPGDVVLGGAAPAGRPSQPGQSVLVLGATGNAGRLALQVARHLGAGRVVAAGRDAAVLATLPASAPTPSVSLAGDADAVAARLGEAAGDVDVVLDYLWGRPDRGRADADPARARRTAVQAA